MIKPTVGRVVWYRPRPGRENELARIGAEPLAAIITAVWSDTCINVALFDGNGILHQRSSITLVQEGELVPAYASYCEWMPYQKGQAAKTEQLQAQIEANG